MAKNQKWVIVLIASMALLAIPVYVIISVLTLAVGLDRFGLNMLYSPWIINLFPFIYAAKGEWYAPQYYLGAAVSLPLSIVQWISIAWIASIFLRDFKRREAFLSAIALLLVVGVVTSAILSAIDIKLISPPIRM